jgi:hypothetical protein
MFGARCGAVDVRDSRERTGVNRHHHRSAPPPQVYRVPARPSPEFIWVEGYWYPKGHHYKWHDGYWTRPPFASAYWVEPYYRRGQYFEGYWDGGHGRFDHHHEWDHDRDRRDEDRSDHHQKHH